MKNEINIIDRLDPRTIKEKLIRNGQYDKERLTVEVKSAMFLTYSLDPKVILALVKALFRDKIDDDKDNNANMDNEDRKKSLKRIIEFIYDNFTDNRNLSDEKEASDFFVPLKDRFAVFYCNGSRKTSEKLSIAECMAMKLAYSVTLENACFHPKVCIVRYSYGLKGEENKKELCRIIAGSQNLSDSGDMEYGCCYDFDVKDDPGQENSFGSWDWLSSLLGNTCILNEYGDEMAYSDMQVYKSITEMKIDLPKGLFITENFNALLGNIKTVYSPFVSAYRVRETSVDTAICTTHYELKKKGFTEAENAGPDTREIYVYDVSDEENNKELIRFPHYKIYVTYDGRVLAGSLNYTDNAFGKNKEILATLPDGAYDDFSSLPYKGNRGRIGGVSPLEKYKKIYVKYDREKTEAACILVREVFKNYIDCYCSKGALSLNIGVNSNKKNCIDSVLLNLEKGSEKEDDYLLRELEKALNNDKNNYRITARLENLYDEEELSKNIEWNTRGTLQQRIVSTTVIFTLWVDNRRKTHCSRQFKMSDKKYSERMEAIFRKVMRYHKGDESNPDPEDTPPGTREGSSRSVAGWSKVLPVPYLDRILSKGDVESRKREIGEIKKRLKELREDISGEILCSDGSILDIGINSSLGIRPSEITTVIKIIKQMEDAVKDLESSMEKRNAAADSTDK